MDFNASGREHVDASEGDDFIMSLDGVLMLTDGEGCERLWCGWGEGESPCADIVIPMPVPWRIVPDGALVVGDS